MRTSGWIVIASIVSAFATTLQAVAEPPTLDRPDKVLRAHGVRLTESAVVAAVHNGDAEVRVAASAVLANR
jgi:hypothetical protein